MNETWEIVCCIVCTAQHKEGREEEKGGIGLVLVFCLIVFLFGFGGFGEMR
jgi:Ca2+/H+ antiporter